MKCLDDYTVIKTLAELGTNFDCASKGEIKKVLELGIEPERIVFTHPCKLISHVEYAREKGITTTVVDTKCELYKLHKYYPEAK